MLLSASRSHPLTHLVHSEANGTRVGMGLGENLQVAGVPLADFVNILLSDVFHLFTKKKIIEHLLCSKHYFSGGKKRGQGTCPYKAYTTAQGIDNKATKVI